MEVVGIYARLSKLRGRDESIATQLRHSRERAEVTYPGCTVIEYRDPDASAEDENVVRPDYERLKSDLLGGRITQVVTSDQERLTRRPDELERLITVFRKAGVAGFTGYRDGWTSFVEGQSAGARYKGVGAKEYVEGIRVKSREKLAANAERGLPAGGRNYGYRRYDDRGQHVVNEQGDKTLEVVPEQADVLRWMAREVLAGRSVTEVAQRLDERDVPRSHGGKHWHPATVAQLLVSPTPAGLRVHRGEIVGRGNWPAILDEPTRRQLLARLGNTPKSPRQTRLRYLLSGLAWCDACDLRLVGNRVAGDRSYYRCSLCGLGISAPLLDRHVRAELWPRLDALAPLLGLDRGHEERREELLAGLREVGEDRELYGRRLAWKELDFETFKGFRDELRARERELNRELADLPAPEEDVSPHAAREGWAGLTVDRRRAVVGAYLHQVRVGPHGAGSRRHFRPERVTILTRVRTGADAGSVEALTGGRRTYRERAGDPVRPDFRLLLEFLELAEIPRTAD